MDITRKARFSNIKYNKPISSTKIKTMIKQNNSNLPSSRLNNLSPGRENNYNSEESDYDESSIEISQDSFSFNDNDNLEESDSISEKNKYDEIKEINENEESEVEEEEESDEGSINSADNEIKKHDFIMTFPNFYHVDYLEFTKYSPKEELNLINFSILYEFLESTDIKLFLMEDFEVNIEKVIFQTKDISYEGILYIDKNYSDSMSRYRILAKKIYIENSIHLRVLLNELKIMYILNETTYCDFIGCFVNEEEKYIYLLYNFEDSPINLIVFLKEVLDKDIKYEVINSILRFVLDLHTAGIIHRDIRPESIFINQHLEIKYFDYYNCITFDKLNDLVVDYNKEKKETERIQQNEKIVNLNVELKEEIKESESEQDNIIGLDKDISDNTKKINVSELSNIDEYKEINQSKHIVNDIGNKNIKDEKSKNISNSSSTSKRDSPNKILNILNKVNTHKFSQVSKENKKFIRHNNMGHNENLLEKDYFFTPKYVGYELGICNPKFGWAQDLYSLGCLILLILLDYSNYDEATFNYLIYKIYWEDLPSNNLKIPRYIEKEIALIIKDCLNKKPSKRCDIIELIEKFNNNVFDKMTNIKDLKIRLTEIQKSNVTLLKEANMSIYQSDEDDDIEETKVKNYHFELCFYHRFMYKKYFCDTCKAFYCDYCIKMTHNNHLFTNTELILDMNEKILNEPIKEMKEKFLDSNYIVIEDLKHKFEEDYSMEKDNINKNYEHLSSIVLDLKERQLASLELSKEQFLKQGFENMFVESQRMLILYTYFYDTKKNYEALSLRMLNTFKNRRALLEENKLKKGEYVSNIFLNLNNSICLYNSELNYINFKEFVSKFEMFEQYCDQFRIMADIIIKKSLSLKMPGEYIFRSEQYTICLD